MSSSLAERGYDVVFMTNEKKQGKPFFHLSEKVKFLNVGGTVFTGFRRFVFKVIKSTPLLKLFTYFDNHKYTSDVVNKYIKTENPDLIILASPQDLMEICYCHDYKAPIIEMVHNVPWNIFERRSKRTLQIILDLMKKVTVCQVLLPSYVDLIKPYYNGKVVVIPNSVPSVEEKFTCDYVEKKNKFVIINIARVTPVKNQELLIKAFAKIHAKNPKWEINFWGFEDKKYKEKLEILIKEFGLQNKVLFKGKTKQPLEEMRNADIFAFPSHFEGFPLALTEAMACGLPSIGLKKAPAVNELIVDGQNGILSDENVDIFAQDLEILMSNVALRKKMGKKAREMVKYYSQERIVDMWDKLIKDLL